MKETPPSNDHTHVRWRRVIGEAKRGCPCIKADDERKAEEAAAIKALADKEKAVDRRLLAIEKALWGRTYEGSFTSRRPQLRCLPISEESESTSLKPKRKKTKA